MELPAIKRGNTSSPHRKSTLRLQPVVIPALRNKVQEITKEHANMKLMQSFLQAKSRRRLSPLKHGSGRRVETEIEAHSGHFLQPSRILLVTSTKWTVFDVFSEKYIRGFKNEERHQLNRYSKLLVFYCVYAIAQKYVLDISKFECIVTVKAELDAGIKGYLNRGSHHMNSDELVSLEALLYLLSLDESNESEYVIAINMGAYLAKKHRGEPFSVYDIKTRDEKVHLETFSLFMNSTAKILSLKLTRVHSLLSAESHQNTTCADDIARLSMQCAKIPLFGRINDLKSYEVQVRCVNEEGELERRQFRVENNIEDTRFLPFRFICKNDSREFGMSSCSCLFEQPGIKIMVVLMNSHSNSERDKDVQKSIEWYLKKRREDEAKHSEEGDY